MNRKFLVREEASITTHYNSAGLAAVLVMYVHHQIPTNCRGQIGKFNVRLNYREVQRTTWLHVRLAMEMELLTGACTGLIQ